MNSTRPKTKKNQTNKKAIARPVIGIIMGSTSDWPTMKAAAECLQDFHVEFEVKIVSAHRTPKMMLEYAETAQARGLKVIIAGAGGAAHLPGMVASATLLPVIGVPVAIPKLDGIDSLLSIVQMPKGIPVATVAIDNAFNAALLAVQILATAEADNSLKTKLREFRVDQTNKVLSAVVALDKRPSN